MAISKAQQKAVHNYVRNNYDRIELTVSPKGKKEQLRAHAVEHNETLNSFIDRAISETIERDNAVPKALDGSAEPAAPDETPNTETLEAFAELDNGGGHSFNGTTEQLFSELMEDEDA